MNLFDIFRKKKTTEKTVESDNACKTYEVGNADDKAEIQQNQQNNIVTLAEFRLSMWIEYASEIEYILRIMKPAVDKLVECGYCVKSVSTSGGSLEYDTGYIPFSGAVYSSFEKATELLPQHFDEEKKSRSGSLFCVVNFEALTVTFTKDDKDYLLAFYNGKLKADSEIAGVISELSFE